MRPRAELNRRIGVLQTPALPLGDVATSRKALLRKSSPNEIARPCSTLLFDPYFGSSGSSASSLSRSSAR